MISESDRLDDHLAAIAELAARALGPLVGAGTPEAIDAAAVAAIRAGLADRDLAAEVVVCEGLKDAAPMLSIGERFGAGEPRLALAVDPVDGTSAVAEGAPGALVALAATRPGSLWSPGALDYVEKLAAGPGATTAIDLDAPIEHNVGAVAAALDKPVSALRVAVLDRERNRELAARIAATGATVVGCRHADLAATIAVGIGRVDLAAGISGAPETVLAAAALAALGGRILARPRGSSTTLETTDLAAPPLWFAAAGVTDSLLLAGLREHRGELVVDTLALTAPGR